MSEINRSGNVVLTLLVYRPEGEEYPVKDGKANDNENNTNE